MVNKVEVQEQLKVNHQSGENNINSFSRNQSDIMQGYNGQPQQVNSESPTNNPQSFDTLGAVTIPEEVTKDIFMKEISKDIQQRFSFGVVGSPNRKTIRIGAEQLLEGNGAMGGEELNSFESAMARGVCGIDKDFTTASIRDPENGISCVLRRDSENGVNVVSGCEVHRGEYNDKGEFIRSPFGSSCEIEFVNCGGDRDKMAAILGDLAKSSYLKYAESVEIKGSVDIEDIEFLKTHLIDQSKINGVSIKFHERNNIETQEYVLGNSSFDAGSTGEDSTAENIDGVNSDVGVDLKQVSYDALNSLTKNPQTFNQYAESVNTPNSLDPSNTIEGIEDNLKTILDGEKSEELNTLKGIEGFINDIKKGINTITLSFKKLVGEHGEELVQKGTIYKGQELPNPASISEFVEGILKGSDNNILVNAVNGLNNIIGKAINDVKTAFSDLSPEAKNLVTSNPEEVEQKTGGLWQGITGWIQEMNDNVKDFFNPTAVEEAERINNYIERLGDNPLDVVPNAISNLKDFQVVSGEDVENITFFENNPSLDTTGKTHGTSDQNALLNNQYPLGIIEKTQSLEALGFANTNDDLVLEGRT